MHPLGLLLCLALTASCAGTLSQVSTKTILLQRAQDKTSPKHIGIHCILLCILYKHELQGRPIFLKEDKFVVDGESSISFSLRREAHFSFLLQRRVAGSIAVDADGGV